jgi:hypothetical protein
MFYSSPTAIDRSRSSPHTRLTFFRTTLKGIRVTGGVAPNAFDFRAAAAIGIVDIVLTDQDSSMKPPGSSAVGTSSIISSSSQMTAFIDATARCHDFSQFGYLYCCQTCFRTFTFGTSPSGTETMVLRVSDKTNPSKKFDFPGMYYYETQMADGATPEQRNSWFKKLRYFAPALPAGSYNAEFIDSQNGQRVWPTFVETTFEKAMCSTALAPAAVQLLVPSPTQNACQQLIRNGDMAASQSSYPYWLHFDSGIELVKGAGIGGTNAIADTVYSVFDAYIGQFLDTRCLEEGRQYEVRAWVKMMNPTTKAIYPCDKGDGTCPIIQLRGQVPNDPNGQTFADFGATYVSSFVRPFDKAGWNLLQGVVTIDSSFAAATSVALVIRRGLPNIKMFLDNVSMTLMPKSCNDLVLNGGFSGGNSTFWEKDSLDSTTSSLEIVSVSGNPALRLRSRSSSSDSISQNIRTGCMAYNERYAAIARVRLLQPNSDILRVCDRGVLTGSKACPRMFLKSFIDIGLPTQSIMLPDGSAIADLDHGVTSDGYYTMTGTFYGTRNDELSEKSVLLIGVGLPAGTDLLIDDVSIMLLPKKCTELLMNGNAQYGKTARFWTTALKETSTIEVVSDGINNSFKVSNRKSVGDGLYQNVDDRCFILGSSWKLSARMKIVSRSTGAAVACDPLSTTNPSACPTVRLTGYKAGALVVEDTYYTNNLVPWTASMWNDYKVSFTVSTVLADCDRVWIGIRQYNLDWDLVVDDLSLVSK